METVAFVNGLWPAYRRPPRKGHDRLPHKGHRRPLRKRTVLMHRIVRNRYVDGRRNRRLILQLRLEIRIKVRDLYLGLGIGI